MSLMAEVTDPAADWLAVMMAAPTTILAGVTVRLMSSAVTPLPTTMARLLLKDACAAASNEETVPASVKSTLTTGLAVLPGGKGGGGEGGGGKGGGG